MDGIKNLLFKYRITLIGVTAGAIAGYLYYYFVGCNSGSCAITSRPLNSTLYGALMGGLTGNIFKKPKTKQPETDIRK